MVLGREGSIEPKGESQCRSYHSFTLRVVIPYIHSKAQWILQYSTYSTYEKSRVEYISTTRGDSLRTHCRMEGGSSIPLNSAL
jgi:hypothetical protein